MNNKIQFILFGDVMTGDNVWHYDVNGHKIDFINKLESLGDVIILKPKYVNFMSYSRKINNNDMNRHYKTGNKDIYFTIEDLQFENYAKWVYEQIDKNKKYISIGLDQGCHFAKYFCNRYYQNCIALYILIDRNLTKEQYKKTFNSEKTYDYIRSIVGNDIEKYKIENITNKTIKELLSIIKNSKNDKYINLLNGIVKGIIRRQYNKINKMKIKTIIYSDINTATIEKIERNKKLEKKSDSEVIYNYVIDNNKYLIHGKYANEIYNNIYGMIKNTLFISIRKIKKSDIKKAKRLVDLYQSERNIKPRKISDDDFWKIAKNSWVDTEVRSIVTIEKTTLRLIIIDTKYRGMGYGSALMEYVKDKVSRLVIDKPYNKSLLKFYNRYGFKKTHEDKKYVEMKK